jgi:hypothetical protein
VLTPAAGCAFVRTGESAVAEEEPDMRRVALPSWTSLPAGNMKRRSDQDPEDDIVGCLYQENVVYVDRLGGTIIRKECDLFLGAT